MQTDETIIYAYDALCGWCYGFSPVIRQFWEAEKERVKFMVLSGGMIRGERAGPIGEVAGYIKTAYKTVEERADVQFGTAFLENVLEEGSTYFSSLRPAIAMVVLRQHQPELVIPFAADLQRAIYFDGIAPDDPTAYVPYAIQYGLDPDEFLQQMNDPRYQALAEEDFALTERFGVRGFPTVMYFTPQRRYILANGYVELDHLQAQLQRARQVAKN